jgi:hypothetical protein
MIVVTGSVTARQDSFEAVKKLSLEHVHRSRSEVRLHLTCRAC